MNKLKLRKLIKESILEGVGSQKAYVTELTGYDVTIYLNGVLGEDDDFTNNSKVKIYWTLETEEREYGLKEIFPVIKKIDLNLVVWREEAQEEEFINKTFDNLSATDGSIINGLKLEIIKNSNTGQMYPTAISIDEKYSSNIEITFDMP